MGRASCLRTSPRWVCRSTCASRRVPGSCSGPTSTQRTFGCKGYAYCFLLDVTCCVDPTTNPNADTGCRLGDNSLNLNFTRVGPNGNSYPYCAKGLPTVSGVAPDSFVASGADQVITLTGTGFDAQGSIYIQGDLLLDTTWTSATSALATVPGHVLATAGTLTGVGYINRKFDASGACEPGASAQCDFRNKSAPRTVPIDAVPSSCVEGGSAASNVSGSGTCVAPYVIDLRTVPSGGVRSHAIGQGEGADEASLPGSYCGGSSTARDVVYRLRLPHGASVQVGVDAVVGSDAQIFFLEDNSCSQPINACGTAGATGQCETVSAQYGSGAFFGTEPFVVVGEGTSSGAGLTVRFKLSGTIPTPTLFSLTPNSASGTGTQMATATLQNGNFWNAYAVFSKDGTQVGQSFCDPTTANTCDFAVPQAALSAPDTYDVTLRFDDIAGTPSTNALPFTTTAAP
jgi:hypothetical protein